MHNFIEEYVSHYLSKPDRAQERNIIILPSKRSVNRLKNEFAQRDHTLWLPEIIDIVSFIGKLSKLEIITKEQTLLEFYKVYADLKKDNKPDSFENYYSWASILISDFNEIDRFLVDSKVFFEHYKALKKLNYFGVEKTKMVKSYIAFWEEMPQYYLALRKHLLNSNQAYQGLAYRIASGNIKEYLKQQDQTSITFVGFNALNNAEKNIIKTCLETGRAEIVWDIDHSFTQNKQHPANMFIKKYQKEWSKFNACFTKINDSHFSKPKTIEILSSPKYIGQAKCVGNILTKLSKKEIQNTAIVLADENLLSPILNSIPESIKNINVTMGLPLTHSPLTDFFNQLIEHQKLQKRSISYDELKKILTHKLVLNNHFEDSNDLIAMLQNKCLLKISYDKLANLNFKDEEIYSLLDCLKIQDNPINFLNCILNYIDILLNHKTPTFTQYLLAYQKLFINLKLNLEAYPGLNIMALKILYKDKEQSEKMNFKGSQTKGLQVMGMLESRLLDFENVILTSVNEGVLPAGKSENSYITYNLKKQYELPTHTEKDAIYAYHFFRLIQRAQKCFLIYDNDQTGLNKGEKSRFISYLQIFKPSNHSLKEKQFSLPTTLSPKKTIEIQKTPEIILKLKKICDRGLSPTALSTYILNPVLFYKRYVLDIKEPDSLDQVINPRDFGTVMHKSIETFYENSDSNLSEDILDNFSKQTEKLLSNEFNKIYHNDSYLRGLNRIQFETARAYLNRFISKEKQALKKDPIKILGIEKTYETFFKTKHHRVKLKGQIDRIELNGDTLRIIDLKTGKVEAKDLKFESFDDLTNQYKFAKAFQILFYSYLYFKKNDTSNFQAGIISFKNLNEWFMPLEYQKNKHISMDILIHFENQLKQLIDEILDQEIAFKEKESIFEL